MTDQCPLFEWTPGVPIVDELLPMEDSMIAANNDVNETNNGDGVELNDNSNDEEIDNNGLIALVEEEDDDELPAFEFHNDNDIDSIMSNDEGDDETSILIKLKMIVL